MMSSLDRWISSKAVVVITGTGTGSGTGINGIGFVTAELLVKKGLTVVGVAQRIEGVEKNAKQLSNEKGKLIPYKADITVESEVVKAFEWIKNNVGPVSILINNAGILPFTNDASLIDGDYETWKKIFDTNVLGLSVATREAVKQMKENNINGHIIHLNSMAGHRVDNMPNIGQYCGSKYAVTALTEALRNELREAGTKIKITSISPGYVSTEMNDLNPNIPADAKAILKTMPSLENVDIADAILYVISTPEHVQIHELIIRQVGSPQ